jgi:hypothetical protein
LESEEDAAFIAANIETRNRKSENKSLDPIGKLFHYLLNHRSAKAVADQIDILKLVLVKVSDDCVAALSRYSNGSSIFSSGRVVS